MLVDDLDALTTHDQHAMFNAFKDVIDRSAGHDSTVTVRVLASCRSNESFAIRAFAQEATIDIAEGNSGDMASQLSAALASMPDWTVEERGEAKAKVLSMAGSRFGYVSVSMGNQCRVTCSANASRSPPLLFRSYNNHSSARSLEGSKIYPKVPRTRTNKHYKAHPQIIWVCCVRH
jgi:hypothetical protein